MIRKVMRNVLKNVLLKMDGPKSLDQPPYPDPFLEWLYQNRYDLVRRYPKKSIVILIDSRKVIYSNSDSMEFCKVIAGMDQEIIFPIHTDALKYYGKNLDIDDGYSEE